MKQNKNINSVVILGSTGNCGKITIEHFLKTGATIFGVARKLSPIDDENYNHIQGDIQDWETFTQLPRNPDMIINFAGVQPSILETSETTDLFKTLTSYIDVNIKGVLNVLRYTLECKNSTYVYTTTHREFENYWKDRKPIANNLPQGINYKGDHTMYAISKYTGRMMGDYFSEAFGLRVFNLRLPMIFLVPEEPYYLANGEKRVMPFLKVIKDAINGEDLEIWGDPEMPRDYVGIQNLINLIELCHRSELDRGTFNVGTGEGVSTEEFVRTIGDVFGPEGEKLNYKYKPDKHTYKSAVYDIKEHKEHLGYEPILLRKMLENLKDEISKNNLMEKWGWTKK